MTINQLTYFVAVVDARINLSRASRRLGISQPNISKQIALLEEEVGAPLFERTGRRLHALTPIGRQLYRHAVNVAEELARLRENVSPHAAARNIVIAASKSSIRYMVPSMLAAAAPIMQGLEVEVQELADSEICQAVREGRCDVGLVSGPVQPDKHLLFLPWYRWRYRLIFSRHGTIGTSLRESSRFLGKHPIAACASVRAPRPSVLRAIETLGITAQISFVSADPEEIKDRVRSNGHIGLIAEMAYSEDLDEDLDSCETPPPFPTLVSWIAVRRTSPLRDGVSTLVSEIASHLQPDMIERMRHNHPIDNPALLVRDLRLPRYG